MHRHGYLQLLGIKGLTLSEKFEPEPDELTWPDEVEPAQEDALEQATI